MLPTTTFEGRGQVITASFIDYSYVSTTELNGPTGARQILPVVFPISRHLSVRDHILTTNCNFEFVKPTR